MVARSNDLPASELASEAAGALAGLDDDRLGVIPACRRLLERHSDVGPLWWVCARMLSADDPAAEARQIQADLAAEQVGLSLALDVPERGDGEVGVAFVGWSPLADELRGRRPDLDVHILDTERGDDVPDGVRILVVDAAAAGNDSFLAPAGTQLAIDSAKHQGVEVWAGVEVGRRLPEPLFLAMRRRVPELDTIKATDVDRRVEPVRIGCPCPPELLHLPAPGFAQ
jgi:hypothetical protein